MKKRKVMIIGNPKIDKVNLRNDTKDGIRNEYLLENPFIEDIKVTNIYDKPRSKYHK